ncbi:HU family DNA-binding protein, partial [candidate division KSB1 bacterium]|nr:HU family DNA-binding protein [candidate division KSB1 bacterium]
EGVPSKKVAGETVEGVFAAIKDCLLKDDSFTFQGFGTFKVQPYAARTGVNPRTGEKVQIAAGKKPKFTASKGLKDAIR